MVAYPATIADVIRMMVGHNDASDRQVAENVAPGGFDLLADQRQRKTTIHHGPTAVIAEQPKIDSSWAKRQSRGEPVHTG